MPNYRVSQTYTDMLKTITTFNSFKNNHGEVISELIHRYFGKRFLVIGAGSSAEMPGMNAFKLFPNQVPYPVQADEIPTFLDGNVTRILISNSGRTSDILIHANSKINNPAIIISSPKGMYGQDKLGKTLKDVYKDRDMPDNWHFVELTSPKELVDAATGSVMEQTAIIQSIYDPLFLEDDMPSQIADKLQEILTGDIGDYARNIINSAFRDYKPGQNKFYITGPDASCVTIESIIKAHEIIGGNIVLSKSLLLVHGQQSSLQKDDVVLLTFPSYWERGHENIQTLTSRVEEKGAKLIYIDRKEPDTIVPGTLLSSLTNSDAYLNLASVWKALLEITAFLNINPDVNKGTKKVGNEEFLGTSRKRQDK